MTASTMPFDRYFQDDPASSQAPHQHRPLAEHPAPAGLQFQLPNFVLGGPPTLAHGGGAEVLPAGLLAAGFGSSSSLSQAWFTNNFSSDFGETVYRSPGSSESQDVVDSYLDSSAAYAASPAPPSSLHWPAASAPPQAQQSHFPLLNHPSTFGLPIYSSSGFDLLSLLARVVHRPNPSITLGPVDLTCAFTVVDTRRFDQPIIYASPTFLQLTGYPEADVLGRNCRFLQAPGGNVQRADERKWTSPESVRTMHKALAAGKECQVSLINYKRGGHAFVNLVSLIPVPPAPGEEAAFVVGFQVDLTQQPNAILQRLKDGSYVVNYASTAQGPNVGSGRSKAHTVSRSAVANDLRQLLSSEAFLRSLSHSEDKTAVEQNDAIGIDALPSVVLNSSPDFIHVLSLKGAFLYCAPTVSRVLGWDAAELTGKSITDYCLQADIVPLMRELKESSGPNPSLTTAAAAKDDGEGKSVAVPQVASAPPKPVDLLFRARHKDGHYVWIECRGRLHVEPGKGRKAIILSGRRRNMPSVDWRRVTQAAGVRPPASSSADKAELADGEFWGMLGPGGTMLVASAGVKHMTGYGVGEVIGRSLVELVDDDDDGESARVIRNAVKETESRAGEAIRRMRCRMRGREVDVALFHSDEWDSSFARARRDVPQPSAAAPVVVQVRVAAFAPASSMAPPSSSVHPPSANLFEELDTSRDSSWHFELQQLRFRNLRLQEEVEALEASLAAAERAARGGGGASRRSSAAGLTLGENPAARNARSVSTSAPSSLGGWRLSNDVVGPVGKVGAKRSWDAVDGGGGG